MATIMQTMKRTVANAPHGTAQRGLGGMILDKGERYGAMAAFSAAKGYYGPKFLWHDHGLDLWFGAAALVGSALTLALSGGRSTLAPHLERIGDAGVMSAIGSLATSWGMSHSGRKVAVLDAGKNSPSLPKAVLGMIEPASKGGVFLTADDLARFADRR